MIAVVWRFEAKPGQERAFENVLRSQRRLGRPEPAQPIVSRDVVSSGGRRAREVPRDRLLVRDGRLREAQGRLMAKSLTRSSARATRCSRASTCASARRSTSPIARGRPTRGVMWGEADSGPVYRRTQGSAPTEPQDASPPEGPRRGREPGQSVRSAPRRAGRRRQPVAMTRARRPPSTTATRRGRSSRATTAPTSDSRRV